MFVEYLWLKRPCQHPSGLGYLFRYINQQRRRTGLVRTLKLVRECNSDDAYIGQNTDPCKHKLTQKCEFERNKNFHAVYMFLLTCFHQFLIIQGCILPFFSTLAKITSSLKHVCRELRSSIHGSNLILISMYSYIPEIM